MSNRVCCLFNFSLPLTVTGINDLRIKIKLGVFTTFQNTQVLEPMGETSLLLSQKEHYKWNVGEQGTVLV